MSQWNNKSLLLPILLLAYCCNAYTQNKRNNIWYFGDYAGIDFNVSPPAPLLNSAMSTFESSAVMSDTSGQLLFYTDGLTVWNKNHQPMPNGTGLLGCQFSGGQSSTQGALIVPMPGNSNLFYLFTTGCQPQNYAEGFRYSVIDMSLAGGNGDVPAAQKNILLMNAVTEKMTALKHSNGSDYWIIVHDLNNADFFAYLLSSTGLSAPVISSTGSVHGNLDGTGQMKAAFNGKKIALVKPGNVIELFDFDPSSGMLSNPLSVTGTAGSGYGLEFSPDSRYLYVADFIDGIYQYNLCASNVKASETLAGPSTFPQQMQLGPDGKIYINLFLLDSLTVIHNPNLQGAACNIKTDFYLGGKFNLNGLPDFAIDWTDSAFAHPADFSGPAYCAGDSVHFTDLSGLSPYTWSWDFGDTTSGGDNFSSIQNPAHLFSGPGTYPVKLIITYGCSSSDTVTNGITLITLPDSLELGKDTAVCAGKNILLDAGIFDTYLWSTGETSRNITASAAGIYSVTASNACGSYSDSLRLSINDCDTPEVCGSVFIPSAFSPNSDGQNDTLYVRGSCITGMEFMVYDRWGEKVFESKSPAKGWDGKVRGVPLDNAVFVYYLKAVLSNGEQVIRKGNVSLLN